MSCVLIRIAWWGATYLHLKGNRIEIPFKTPGAVIKPRWLELPLSRTNFHGPKGVRAIEGRLYNYFKQKFLTYILQYITTMKYI